MGKEYRGRNGKDRIYKMKKRRRNSGYKTVFTWEEGKKGTGDDGGKGK
jgi:hypothetical protein